MVGKLLKYDLRAYFRVLSPMYLVLLSVALVTRIVQFFEPARDSLGNRLDVYEIIFVSFCILLTIVCIAVLVISVAQIILVFYRNLFSREGYLSFTLPVSTNAHLWAKLIGSVIVSVASTLMILVAVAIATMGEMLVELVKAGNYLLFKEILANVSTGHIVALGIEAFLLLLLASLASTLFEYLCIAIGQQAKKNRVLAAFGVFFFFFVILQILATVFVISISIDYEWFERFIEWFTLKKINGAHLALWLCIGVSAIIGAVEYFFCHRRITPRLNLE